MFRARENERLRGILVFINFTASQKRFGQASRLSATVTRAANELRPRKNRETAERKEEIRNQFTEIFIVCC